MGKLTAKEVASLSTPGRHTDGDGLILFIDSAGRKYWQLRYTLSGKRHDLALGSERKMSLKDARHAALQARLLIRDGVDPREQRKAQTATQTTFAEAARTVHGNQKEGWRNGKHCDQWLATLENHAFPMIGNNPVASLTRADMLAVLSPIWLSHQETARRVLQRMRAVIYWAVANNLREDGIDFEIVRRALPKQRRKVRHMAAIHYTEMRSFRDALAFAKAKPIARAALELLALTAARPGNIRFMEWSEVNFERAVWLVPAAKMKTGRDHPVPLPKRATEILHAMQSFRSPIAPWVFPGEKSGLPMSENTLCKAIQDMGFDATAHGFRSTFKDWARVGYPDWLSEFQLAHIDENATREAYGRDGHLALRREMMNQWSDALAGHIPMPKHERTPMAA